MAANLTYRNTTKRGPSIGKHLAAAFLVVLAVPAIASAFTYWNGDPNDAIARGQAALGVAPPAPGSLNLNSAMTALPDILDSEDVAELTAPVASDNTASQLAGAQPAPTPARPSGPKVVLIDGRPLGSGETIIGQTQTLRTGNALTVINSSGPLTRAPIIGLTRSSPFGPVPTPNASGMTPFTAYAKPYISPPASKQVALIVGGLGINAEQTRRAINSLPPEVTLSFAAHASGLQNWINQARTRGHEVILELPMEPYNFDPRAPNGRYVLRADTDAASNIRNLDYLLSRGQGYFAVTNYLGEKFLDSGTALSPVIKHLNDSGVGFIHDGVGQNETLEASLNGSNVPWARNRVVIDVTPGEASVAQVLRALEGSATTKGVALGVGFSYPETIDAIISWTDGLDERGITLAPASAAL